MGLDIALPTGRGRIGHEGSCGRCLNEKEKNILIGLEKREPVVAKLFRGTILIY